MKHLITEQDIRQGAIAGTITVTPDVIITPAALDAAYARGLKVVFTEDASGGTAAPAASPSPDRGGSAAAPGTVRVTVPAGAGRVYVVQVFAQGARVFEPRGDALVNRSE
ncbi:MAG: hypothetical protein HYY93_09645 [Planctomycetes bacterium]|nr:hypothetical protein [Planctomycetota bacterium]